VTRTARIRQIFNQSLSREEWEEEERVDEQAGVVFGR
jgi:hypothetical protein